MRSFEPAERFTLIMGHIDARDSLRENMTTCPDRAQRGKLFKWKLHSLG